MCPPGYHCNGFLATHVCHGSLTTNYLPACLPACLSVYLSMATYIMLPPYLAC